MSDENDGAGTIDRIAAESGPTILAGLLVALYVAAFDWAATRVYLLNFSPDGPNATAVLFLLFVTGWVVALVALVDPSPGVLYGGGVVATGVGVAGGFVGNVVLAGAAGVLAMTAATPVLVALVAQTRDRFAIGAAGGLLLQGAFRTWLTTASPYGTTLGKAFLGVATLATIALGVALVSRDALETPDWSTLRVSVAPVGAFLVVEATWLGMPHVVARWTPRPYLLAVVASVVGLAGGAAWIARRGGPTGESRFGWGVVFVLSAAALLFVDLGAVVVLLAPAQAGAVVLLAAGCHELDETGWPRATGELVAVQFLAVVIVFLYISAANWAYMPSLVGSLTRGGDLVFLLALHSLLPISAAATSLRDVASRDPPAPVDHSRRAIASSAALAGLGLSGLIPSALSGVEDPDQSADPRFLSLNVHQYLDGTDAGTYNFEAVADLLDRTDPHVVGLQETGGTKVTSGNVDGVRWLAETLGYHAHYGVPARVGSYGVALLSKWPIEDASTFYLPVGESIVRPTLVATVQTPDGPLRTVVTHFEVGKENDRHVEAAERIVQSVADVDDAVVMGDFNLRPDDEAYATLSESLTDAWTAANGADGGYTWAAGDPVMRIDYVWYAGDWTVDETSVVGNPHVSDHLGVLSTAARET